MAEMPDVVTGEVISSDWGNDIRDRSIQRYANTTERSTLNPSPSAGDLAFMEDTGRILAYYGGAWVLMSLADGQVTTVKLGDLAVTTAKIADGNVTGAKGSATFMASYLVVASNFSEGLDTIGISLATLFSITLSIPAAWSSWSCEVNGKTTIRQSADSTSATTDDIVIETVIDGTANEFHSSRIGRQAFGGTFGMANSEVSIPIHAFRTGMTTTGSRTINIQRARNGLDNVYSMLNTVATARALRLS